MKQLIFLVEGKSEVIFIERYLIPYLYQQKEVLQAVPMRAQTIRTNRKLHKKGGAPNYPKVKKLIAYKKVADTDPIFSEINLDNVRKKCPRFNHWINTLLQFNYT